MIALTQSILARLFLAACFVMPTPGMAVDCSSCPANVVASAAEVTSRELASSPTACCTKHDEQIATHSVPVDEDADHQKSPPCEQYCMACYSARPFAPAAPLSALQVSTLSHDELINIPHCPPIQPVASCVFHPPKA